MNREENSRFCGACGETVVLGSRFCANCGAELSQFEIALEAETGGEARKKAVTAEPVVIKTRQALTPTAPVAPPGPAQKPIVEGCDPRRPAEKPADSSTSRGVNPANEKDVLFSAVIPTIFFGSGLFIPLMVVLSIAGVGPGMHLFPFYLLCMVGGAVIWGKVK
jgi:hypothetical protein